MSCTFFDKKMHFHTSSLLFFSKYIGAHQAQTLLYVSLKIKSYGLTPVICQHYE